MSRLEFIQFVIWSKSQDIFSVLNLQILDSKQQGNIDDYRFEFKKET